MIAISENDTIASVLRSAADAYGDLPLLAVPANAQRDYCQAGFELSYRDMALAVSELAQGYQEAGYGLGHRMGLFLDNQPAHFLHKLALNSIGACCVPINPDYRSAELGYLIDHARLDLVVALPSRLPALEQALQTTTHQPAIALIDHGQGEQMQAIHAVLKPAFQSAARPVSAGVLDANTPSSILYTSGTTGRPKGCVLSHRYEIAAGAWYATRGHLAQIREGQERLYNPLPQFHVNASILSFFCMMLTGGCQVQAERFQPSRWWTEVSESGATIVHYLGVIVPMLLNQPASDAERAHKVRFGFGAGVEPELHARFEQRFGFPLLEIWGMTEIVRVLVDNESTRQVGTRAFGRSMPGLEVRVADHLGQEVAPGDVGEMLVRHSEAQPRKDFFNGYLDDPVATEQAWAGGWFHTGDMVTQDATGMLHFVDRQKNIIRRAGENIAAAEVAAVMAVPDELREQEVLACIVLKSEVSTSNADELFSDAAREIFGFCLDRLAYYKAPGWIIFRNEIPTTGTQKIQKHRIFEAGTDPRADPHAIDLRGLKKRS